MALRVGFHTFPRVAAAALALTALLMALVALLGASGASAAARAKPPEITSVSPARTTVGERLTVRGRHFRRGKGRNTLVLKRDGARSVFVRADISTSKMMRVVMPERLTRFLAVENGTPQFTRFRARVISARLGRSFTSVSRSPVIGPRKPPAPPAQPAPPADGDCDFDGTPNAVDLDDDGDLLTDATEARIRTDSCRLDSDGDGVGDGYEFQSALHLNNDEYQEPNNSLPYPEKRPYPNALFADASIDFDGDGLTLGEEHKLWKATGDPGAGLEALNYSDGLQYSIYERYSGDRRRGAILADNYDKHQDFLAWASSKPPYPLDQDDPAGYLNVMLNKVRSSESEPSEVELFDIRDMNRDGELDKTPTPLSGEVYYTSERLYFDIDGNGRLSDDERDEDADGLTNYDESHGRLTPAYWKGCYSMEGAYPVPYAGTDLTDPDSDGDGVRDGADDQDHDDIPNLMEMSRNAGSGRPYTNECDQNGATPSPSPVKGWVNPFNPCLPDRWSRTCTRHPSVGAGYAPFGAGIPRYLVLN